MVDTTKSWGITPDGFVRKRYPDILKSMQDRAKKNYGEDVNLDTDKPLGKFLDIFAFMCSELWELGEDTYNAISIDSATGIQLDRVVKYKGLTRQELQYAFGIVKIQGVPQTNLPKNFIVSTQENIQYYTSQSCAIPDTGDIDVYVTCSEAGTKGNAAIGQINKIVTPITGANAVSNLKPFINGHDYEHDYQLRERYYYTIGGLSATEIIRKALVEVDGVLSQVIKENDTEKTVDGIPPKSIEVFVYGGMDNDIAKAILESKPAGIRAFGTTVISIADKNEFIHNIGFTRAAEIYIDVKVTIKSNQFYSAEGNARIKTLIINYIGGEDKDGTEYDGLKIADNVNRSYIISKVWSITGLDDVKVSIKKSNQDDYDVSVSEIEIDKTEIARSNYINVEVIQI